MNKYIQTNNYSGRKTNQTNHGIALDSLFVKKSLNKNKFESYVCGEPYFFII